MAKLTVDPSGNYIVQPSDTLSKIASLQGRTLSDLLSANPQYASNPNMIHAGDVIKPTLASLGVPSITGGTPTNSTSALSAPSMYSQLTAGTSTPKATPVVSSKTGGAPVPGIGTPLTTPSPVTSPQATPTTIAATTPASTTAPTTGTHTPQEVILAIMKDLQGKQEQGQAGLLAQQNQIQGTGFGLQNNVLNNTAMTPGAQTAAFNAAPGAVQNGVLSNNQQLQLGNQAFSNANDLLKTSLDTYKPVSLGYGGLYDPGSGKIINQLSGGAGDAITNAIQNGQVTPDMISRYGQPYIAAVLAKDPGYNFITGQAGKNFATSPQTQTFIANANTAINTLNEIKGLSDLVDRGNLKLLNNGLFALKSGTSDKATAKLLTDQSILADELGKILGSGQGSDFAIQLGSGLIDPNYSADTFGSIIDLLKGRITNKLSEYQTQASQGNQSGNTTNSTSGSTGGGFATTW